MKRFSILALALVAAACARDSHFTAPIDVPSGQTFELAIGQSAHITGPIATLTVLSVPEDSRCPVSTLGECISAGNARVRIQVSMDTRTDTVELNTTSDPQDVTVGTLKIRLAALTPDRHDFGPVEASLYRASLVVTGRVD